MPQTNSVRVEVGRVGNGVVAKLLEEGSTVGDLLDIADFELNEDKEVIIAKESGLKVDLDDELEDGECYQITPEIKSA